jgi:hypothetical protein
MKSSGVPKVSLSDLNKFKVSFNVTKKVKKTAEHKDVEMEVGEMTPNGDMEIKFNQKMNVPFNFIKEGSDTRRALKERNGVYLSEVDPKSIFHAYIIQKSSEEPSDLAYQFDLKDWTEDKIKMKVNF